MADKKLRRMERKRFTSPVAMLDALAYNIAVLADKAGLEFEEPQTALSFKSRLGASPLAFSVEIDGETYESDATTGIATAVVARSGAVDYKVTADGFEDIEGTITPECLNVEVLLSWTPEVAVKE